MSARLKELSVIAESNDEVALQLESEVALSLKGDRLHQHALHMAWADEVADSYLIVTTPKADDKTIDELAQEVDF